MAQMLTAKQVAEVKGCSPRYIKKIIQDGKLKAVETVNSKNRKTYLVPLDALDEELQHKYYQLIAENPPEEVERPEPEVEKVAIDEFTEDERKEIDFWIDLTKRWQSYRKMPGVTSLAEVDKKFVTLCSLEYPERSISVDTLYRKWNAVKADDMKALVDKRNKWKKGTSSIDETIWQAFLYYYLDEAQHPVTKCLEYTKMWAQEKRPDLYTQIPAYPSFYRRLKSVPEGVKVLGREGHKAFNDRCGSCFEMLYLDEDAQIRFAKVAPSDLIMIYESDSGHAQPMAAIRSVRSVDKDKNVILKVEFWNAYQVLRFRSFNNGYLNLEAIEDHYWQDVPFVEYINNEERRGDFEGVITEIDAYNKAQSNTANYFQYNDDAILKILKLGDVSSDDVRDMKEKGAIILDDGGDVQWLLKQVDDTAMENFKNRLREDIHTMSHVPHLCDESFGGNLSGVAIAYKLWGLEQLCAMKERKFKKGLQRRIELITNILNIKGGHYDYKDITPKFRRNKPENNLELTQIATQLSGLLSTESRLQMLPWVENVHDEMEKLEEEKTKDVDEFGTYENFAKAFESQQNGMTAGTAAEGVDESERTE